MGQENTPNTKVKQFHNCGLHTNEYQTYQLYTHTSSVSTHNIHLLKYVLKDTRSCMEMDDILIFLWSSIPFRVKNGSRLHTVVGEVGGKASAKVVVHHGGGAECRGRTTELLQCSHNASAVFILCGAHHHQLVVSVPYGQAQPHTQLTLSDCKKSWPQVVVSVPYGQPQPHTQLPLSNCTKHDNRL